MQKWCSQRSLTPLSGSWPYVVTHFKSIIIVCIWLLGAVNLWDALKPWLQFYKGFYFFFYITCQWKPVKMFPHLSLCFIFFYEIITAGDTLTSVTTMENRVYSPYSKPNPRFIRKKRESNVRLTQSWIVLNSEDTQQLKSQFIVKQLTPGDSGALEEEHRKLNRDAARMILSSICALGALPGPILLYWVSDSQPRGCGP